MVFDIHQNEWMEMYNAELTSGAGLRILLPGERDENTQQFRNRLRHQKAKDRRTGLSEHVEE